MCILPKLFFASSSAAANAGSVITVQELIGSGNDRDCWRLGPDLCVKVAKPEQERPQNEIDFHYARYLADKNIASPYMPKVHGWVLTNKGPGLVFDLVLNYDGGVSNPVLAALQQRQINTEQAIAIVRQTFNWLKHDKVILADYGISNLLVQNYAPGKFRLVIIDGLGARKFGWRYFLNRLLGFKAVIKAKEFEQMTIDKIMAAATSK